MDIQAEKILLIEWLAELNDPRTLDEFISLKKAKEVDWWNEISSDEQEEIKIGLEQANRSEFTSHKEVMAKYKRWL